ncbi:hypothetical protein HDU93_006303, partial [Gonapodya sp. JEL0774]
DVKPDVDEHEPETADGPDAQDGDGGTTASREAGWSSLLGSLRIVSPHRLGYILHELAIFTDFDDYPELSVGRVLSRCSYLPRSSVRRVIEDLSHRGSFSTPEMWTEVALAERWTDDQLMTQIVDLSKDSSRTPGEVASSTRSNVVGALEHLRMRSVDVNEEDFTKRIVNILRNLKNALGLTISDLAHVLVNSSLDNRGDIIWLLNFPEEEMVALIRTVLDSYYYLPGIVPSFLRLGGAAGARMIFKACNDPIVVIASVFYVARSPGTAGNQPVWPLLAGCLSLHAQGCSCNYDSPTSTPKAPKFDDVQVAAVLSLFLTLFPKEGDVQQRYGRLRLYL